MRPRQPLGPRALAAALVLAVVALAGCGGGGGSGTVTKAKYIQQVNPLCNTEKLELSNLAETATSVLQKATEANVIRERTYTKISAVKPPASEAISPEWLRLRAAAIAAVKAIAAAPPRSRESDAANLRFLTSNNRAQKLAVSYGLSSCGGFAAT